MREPLRITSERQESILYYSNSSEAVIYSYSSGNKTRLRPRFSKQGARMPASHFLDSGLFLTGKKLRPGQEPRGGLFG